MTPRFDLDAALAYVGALTDSPDSGVTLQTFTDGPKPEPDPLAKVMHGTVRELAPGIETLIESGAGVFVCANETDSAGRGEHNIVNIRAVWADMDSQTAEPPPFPIQPHIIVETSPRKWQCIWRVAGIDRAQHAAVLATICARHGADSGAKGINRVLRLAGTLHQKGDPFRVRLHSVADRVPYTADEITVAFPPTAANESEITPRMNIADLIDEVKRGQNMHDSIVKIAYRLATANIDQSATLEFLRAIVARSVRADEWRAQGRDGELVRAAISAYKKQQTEGFKDAGTGKALEPLDLFADASEPVEFTPADFPYPVGAFAQDVARRMGADPLPATFVGLAACVAMLGDSYVLQMKANDPNWFEHSRLWVAVVGEPSAKKSPVFKAMLAAVSRRQGRLYEAHAAEREKYRHEAAAAKAAKRPTPAEPRARRLLANDATTEALMNVLDANSEGLLVVHDELSGWFGGLDAYRPNGASKDRAFYLSAYNGGGVAVDRVGTGERYIENLSLSMLGGIQPAPMRRIANKLEDDGLLQRFVVLIARDATMGADVPPDPQASADWEKLMQAFAETRDGTRVWPKRYRLAPDAQRAMDAARVRIFDLMRAPGTDARVKSALGKCEGQLARLTLIYHLIENREGEDLFSGEAAPAEIVTYATTSKAIGMFLRVVIPSMLRFYADIVGRSELHEDMRWIAGFILARRLDSVTARELYRAHSKLQGEEGRRQLQDCMANLELAAWVEPTGDRRNATQWRVNSEVHQRFAERAALEAARRERERAEICERAAQRRDGTFD